jgi:hypothetical protein
MQRQILKMKERQQKSLDSRGTKIKSMGYLEGNNEEILRAEAKKTEDIHEMAAYSKNIAFYAKYPQQNTKELFLLHYFLFLYLSSITFVQAIAVKNLIQKFSTTS